MLKIVAGGLGFVNRAMQLCYRAEWPLADIKAKIITKELFLLNKTIKNCFW